VNIFLATCKKLKYRHDLGEIKEVPNSKCPDITSVLFYIEFFLGRYTAQDIAVFARDTSSSKVFTLGPDSFPSPVTTGEENWFVDFFAPVRPVCDIRVWRISQM
jgi:hypothetical protein